MHALDSHVFVPCFFNMNQSAYIFYHRVCMSDLQKEGSFWSSAFDPADQIYTQLTTWAPGINIRILVLYH